MAKSDINRLTGRYGPPIDRARKGFLQETFNKIDRDLNAEKKRALQVGPKAIAIKAYLESGKNRKYVYSCMQQKYKRNNGEPAFLKAQIDKWIDEYEENKKRVRDDDDAR